MDVRFYGKLADMFGEAIAIDLEGGGTVADVRRRCIAARPAAADAMDARRARACVGDALVLEDHAVGPDDVVEFLPPVSGG